jgi:hypothetical protein
MLKKYYTYEAIIDGTVLGSGVIAVWFWQSPVKAHRLVTEMLGEGVQQINFRPIK